jgi:hypothetical protein
MFTFIKANDDIARLNELNKVVLDLGDVVGLANTHAGRPGDINQRHKASAAIPPEIAHFNHPGAFFGSEIVTHHRLITNATINGNIVGNSTGSTNDQLGRVIDVTYRTAAQESAAIALAVAGLSGTNIFTWSLGGPTNFPLSFVQNQNPSYTFNTNVINFTNVTGTAGAIAFVLTNTTVTYDPKFLWQTTHPSKVTNGLVVFQQFGPITVGAYGEFQ